MRTRYKLRRLFHRFFGIVLISAAVALPPGTGAEAQPIELPGIVIEGATLEAPPSRASTPGTAEDEVGGIPAREIGSAVTVVTGEQLRAQQIRHAADALRSLPGVAVGHSAGTRAGLTQVRIRGAEGNHTLVLIDGVEANDTNDGEFDFSNLLAEDIERIEVIRGPQSGLYGSKAIGGVINIVTRGGRGPLTIAARAEGGAYITRDAAVRVSAGNDRAWFALSTNYRAENGFNVAIDGSEEDPWRQSTIHLRGGATIMDGVALDFVFRRMDKFAHTDPEGVPPGGTLNAALDGPDTVDVDHFLGGVNLRWDMMGGALTHVLRANRNATSITSNTAFGTSDNQGEANRFGYLATYRFATPDLLAARHSVSGLVEKEFESFTPIASFTDGLERERTRLATVGEYRGEFIDRVFLTASVRHDDNDTFKDFTTWRTAVSIDLREQRMRPHASVGTGVALPGMFEQFGTILGDFVGNPNLVPEESFGWDAGIEFTLLNGRAILDLTYFRTNLENEIAGFGNSMINLEGESRRQGIEVSARAQIMPSLSVGASYTWLDATDPGGSPEIRRPEHSARADLNYVFDGGRGNLNLAAAYNGETTDQNFGTFPATVVTLDEYWLLSAAASYNPARYRVVRTSREHPERGLRGGIRLQHSGPCCLRRREVHLHGNWRRRRSLKLRVARKPVVRRKLEPRQTSPCSGCLQMLEASTGPPCEKGGPVGLAAERAQCCF